MAPFVYRVYERTETVASALLVARSHSQIKNPQRTMGQTHGADWKREGYVLRIIEDLSGELCFV